MILYNFLYLIKEFALENLYKCAEEFSDKKI